MAANTQASDTITTATINNNKIQGNRRESYISTQLQSINFQLQSLFDEIGISAQERDTRERTVYAVISKALEEHVEQVTQERDEIYARCVETQSLLQEMLNSLKDLDINYILQGNNRNIVYEQIQPPYQQSCQDLENAYEKIESVYSERLVRINQTFEQLKELSTKVDNVSINDNLVLKDEDLDLSNAHIVNLEHEVEKWQEELSKRISQVANYAAQTVSLYAELGTPQNEINSDILNCYRSNPERLGTLEKDIQRIKEIYEQLENDKQNRIERIQILKQQIEPLWGKLEEDEETTKLFDRSNRGLAWGVIEAHEKELARLNEKKRQFIHVFIQDARSKLKTLWEKLYFSEDETYNFTPAWTDVFTDASLDAHEQEISRLESLVEERKPILSLINEFYSLQHDAEALEASSQDSSRLLSKGPGRREPGRLLKEEQMRKRIAKKQPKVLQELRAALDAYTSKNQKSFYVNGQDFDIELRQLEEKKGLRGRKNHVTGGANSSTARSTSPTKTQPLTTSSRNNVQTSPQKSKSVSPVKKNIRPRPVSPTKSTTSSNSSTSTFKKPFGNGMRIPSAPVSKGHNTNSSNLHRRNMSQPKLQVQNSQLNLQSANTLNRQLSFDKIVNKNTETNKMTMRIPSVTGSTTSSENWEAYEDDSSDDDIMMNSDYVKWREENMRRLQQKRESECHWPSNEHEPESAETE